MSDFRLAHITDLHLTTKRDWLNPLEGSSGPMEALKRAYNHWFYSGNQYTSPFHPSGYNADAAQRALHAIVRDDPDAVLITGDLATTGEREDVAAAVDYLRGKAPTWWNGSGVIPDLVKALPVLPMPGNHDRYSGIFSFPSSSEFEAQFGSYWDFDQNLNYSATNSQKETRRVRLSTFQKGDKVLGIVSADMSLNDAHQAEGGKLAYYGQGRATHMILAEMVGATTAVYTEAEGEGKQAAVLWAVHYPPKFPKIVADLDLLESQELIEAAALADVSLVVAGHTHKTGEYRVEAKNQKRSVRVLCSGPTCGLGEHDEYGFSILDIEVPSAREIKCIPIHFRWQGFDFFPQSSFPVLS